MKQTLPPFHGTIYNEKYSTGKKSEGAVLLLHGYPSPDSKNEYIAEFMAEHLSQDAFVLHYEGLGKSQGAFSFPKSVTDAIAYYESLVSQGYKHITIVGHSWGGLIALNLIAMVDTSAIDRLILMSPFNYFPTGVELEKLIDFIYSDSQVEFKQSKSEMIKQVGVITSSYQPRSKIDKIRLFAKPVHIFQAIHDLEVPPATTTEFVKAIGNKNVHLEQIDTDHSFTENRKAFLARVLSVMRSE
jgi:esterase/lipase